jgi:hypothetical protein
MINNVDGDKTKMANKTLKRKVSRYLIQYRDIHNSDIVSIVISCPSFASTQKYIEVESGIKQINLKQLVEICNFWNITPDELLFGNNTIR